MLSHVEKQCYSHGYEARITLHKGGSLVRYTMNDVISIVNDYWLLCWNPLFYFRIVRCKTSLDPKPFIAFQQLHAEKWEAAHVHNIIMALYKIEEGLETKTNGDHTDYNIIIIHFTVPLYEYILYSMCHVDYSIIYKLTCSSLLVH